MESMVGCIGNLYASVEKLGDPYMQPGAAKDAILSPTVLSPAASPKSSLLRLPEPPSAPKSFFRCNSGGSYSSCRNYVTNHRGARCPSCGSQMIYDYSYVSSGSVTLTPEAKGFVQGGMATYTVTDDLMIFPMSNISNMAMLNTVAVRDLGTLQEKTVQLGYEEGLAILKASLMSKTVLTDVFLRKKPNNSTPSINNDRSLPWGA